MKKWIVLIVVVCVALGFWWNYSARQTPALNVIGEDTANLSAMMVVSRDVEKMTGLRAAFTKASYDDLVKRSGEDLANHTGLFDVLLQYPLSISTYAQHDWIVPVEEYKGLSDKSTALETESNDIFTNVWKEIGYYGRSGNQAKAYGVPFAANTMLLCYNRKLLENKQNQDDYNTKYHEPLTVPKTWQQFYRVAEFFTGRNDCSGICLEGADYWIAWEWSNFAFSFGGGVMKKQYGWQTPPSSELSVDSLESVEATKFWLSLKPFNATKNFVGTTVQEQVAEMQKGKTALCLLWSDNAYTILHGPGGIDFSETFGFSPIPGNKAMIAGGIFMINRSSRKKSEAIHFIAAMLERDNQVRLAQVGLCSPRKSTYQDPVVQKLPYSGALYDSLSHGVYMLDAGPDSDLVFVTLSRYLKEIWIGQSTVEEGLKRARKEIEAGREKIFSEIGKQ